jgi:hypothetical protein
MSIDFGLLFAFGHLFIVHVCVCLLLPFFLVFVDHKHVCPSLAILCNHGF